MKDIDDMDPVELGRYFGYPDCCILHFCGRAVVMQMGYLKMAAIPPGNPFDETGYVPCPSCRQNRTKEHMLATITQNRKCPLPFPEDGLSNEAVLVAVRERD